MQHTNIFRFFLNKKSWFSGSFFLSLSVSISCAMSEVPLKHKIALGLIPRIGDINARKLVSHFGSVEAIFHEPYRNLIKAVNIYLHSIVIFPKFRKVSM
jgi:hypothetical protein